MSVFECIEAVFRRDRRPQESLAVKITSNKMIGGGLAAAFDRKADELNQPEMKMFITLATYIYREDPDIAREIHEELRRIERGGVINSIGNPKTLTQEGLGQYAWEYMVRPKIKEWLSANPGIGKADIGYINSMNYVESLK